jgi:hypothetical protein
MLGDELGVTDGVGDAVNSYSQSPHSRSNSKDWTLKFEVPQVKNEKCNSPGASVAQLNGNTSDPIFDEQYPTKGRYDPPLLH